jgi:hypothetical protein
MIAMPRENQTGLAGLAIFSVFGYPATAIAWLAGAGWWSLLALPAPFLLLMLSFVVREWLDRNRART